MVLTELKNQIAHLIGTALEDGVQANEIVKPPKADMGDFAYGCFVQAKARGTNPAELATEIVGKIDVSTISVIDEVKAAGPYVNVFVNTAGLAALLSKEILQTKEEYGWTDTEDGEIVFEYSGLNTHKEVHIGHVRNHALGFSLVQLLRSQGNVVHPVNFTNDMGAHVAKCLWGLQKFHDSTLDVENKMEGLADVYVESTREAGDDEEKKLEIQKVLQAIEDEPSSPEYKLWEETREWSLDGFKKVYAEMGMEFEDWFFESAVKEGGKKKVQQLLEQGVARQSDGAIIADLEEEKLGVLLLLKSDGTGLYSTTDLGLIDAKLAAFPNATASWVITDFRQNQYFSQLYRVLELSGLRANLVHIGYEFVTLPEGAMSSRTGTIIRHRDLRDALIARATEEITARHEDWSEDQVAEVAQKIALGAMKFVMVSVGSNQKIVFDMDEALALSGMSSVALQYAGARMHAILEKVGKVGEMDFAGLDAPIEKQLVMHLAWYPQVLAQAATDKDPSGVARWAYELTQLFGTFYEAQYVIDQEGVVHTGRAGLIQAMHQAMQAALGILGIPYLEKM